jgi:hypothetical protein
MIRSGELKPGYACDNDAGIFFQDNEVMRVVATRPGAKCYYVSVVNGQVVERSWSRSSSNRREGGRLPREGPPMNRRPLRWILALTPPAAGLK